MSNRKENLIWIDLEMTGLDPSADRIIEIATVITDGNLEVLAEGPVIAIHQSDRVMTTMDEWNTRHHGDSGLTTRVRESRYTETDAEKMTIDFLSEWVEAGCSPMCGNSICQDRRFMVNSMAELERYFHYRNLDVSTVKELARRWAPAVAAGVKKKNVHLALADVHESIEELRHYRTHLFNLTAQGSGYRLD